jgi:hypothetical protein
MLNQTQIDSSKTTSSAAKNTSSGSAANRREQQRAETERAIELDRQLLTLVVHRSLRTHAGGAGIMCPLFCAHGQRRGCLLGSIRCSLGARIDRDAYRRLSSSSYRAGRQAGDAIALDDQTDWEDYMSERQMRWEVAFAYLRGMPAYIETTDTGRDEVGRYRDLEAKIRALARTRKLEFVHFTDQVDVWERRASGRRDRFMVLQAA